MSEQDRIDAEALDWVERLNGDDVPVEDIEAYVIWMEADPAHADAYRRLEEAWIASSDAADAVRARFGPEARAAGNGEGLLAAIGAFLRPFVEPSFSPQFAGAVAAAVAVLIVAVQPPSQAPSGNVLVYATEIGARRDVVLEDGSRISLNTATEVVVTLSEQERAVELVRGEAFFDVASDANRPFIVQAGEGQVAVLGTEFNVRLTESGFNVAVAEGRVAVSPALEAMSAPEHVLTAAQGAAVNTEVASVSLFVVDTDRLTAWRRGQLVYRDTPLSEVVADLSRYVDSDILISEAGLETLAFTGVLNIDTPEVMVQRLADLMELSVSFDPDGTIWMSPAE